MPKAADDYAKEILDLVLNKKPKSEQDRRQVRGDVRRKIVESWRQERGLLRMRIKTGLKGLPLANQNGVEMISLSDAEHVVDVGPGHSR